jgi:riboflavin kinase/FMN adenylyltransferase
MSTSSILQSYPSSPLILSPRPVLEGEVVHGDARGRTLGFPTANMEFSGDGLPDFGVYAVRVYGKDGSLSLLHDGVASFGIRPMFRTSEPLLETHLFDFQGDLYGQVLVVELVAWLRPEVKFSGLEALVAQIAADAAQARHILAVTSDHLAVRQDVMETVA